MWTQRGKERVGRTERGALKKYTATCEKDSGWEVGRRFRIEETYVYLWLIHIDVWQKPT